jgi:hypothetical protein
MVRCIVVRLLSLLRNAYECFNVCMTAGKSCGIGCNFEFLLQVIYSLVECFGSYVLFAIRMTISSNTAEYRDYGVNI